MMDELYDLIDSAAKRYPIKALAPEIDKAESTLRGELNRQPEHKLGLSTALLIIEKTWDSGGREALDKIEAEVEQTPEIKHLLEFCRASEKGITR